MGKRADKLVTVSANVTVPPDRFLRIKPIPSATGADNLIEMELPNQAFGPLCHGVANG